MKIDVALTCPRREGAGQSDGLFAFASVLLSGLWGTDSIAALPCMFTGLTETGHSGRSGGHAL
ncbi:MAG TPA: hypothetical protein VED20_01135 [Streptosporangiaceae bacterium]|nr:hypothetical protein [Streptosporangiaceae bacterium]